MWKIGLKICKVCPSQDQNHLLLKMSTGELWLGEVSSSTTGENEEGATIKASKVWVTILWSGGEDFSTPPFGFSNSDQFSWQSWSLTTTSTTGTSLSCSSLRSCWRKEVIVFMFFLLSGWGDCINSRGDYLFVIIVVAKITAWYNAVTVRFHT